MTRRRSQADDGDGPLRVIGYVRVSTEEQAASGAGLAAQRKTIADAVALRGLELVDIAEDAASGKSMVRPGITNALERIEAGEADALLVAKLDRLSRSLLDFSGLMERARAKGWAIIALDLGVDTTTPSGEMMANVLATFSQFERRLIGQRTREALATRKADGVRLGRPRSVPGDVVARVLAERAAGRTLTAIADGLTTDDVPTSQRGVRWYASTIRQVLKTAATQPD
jgi:DNA invertase Pin-like site-specific DNA recombinase